MADILEETTLRTLGYYRTLLANRIFCAAVERLPVRFWGYK